MQLGCIYPRRRSTLTLTGGCALLDVGKIAKVARLEVEPRSAQRPRRAGERGPRQLPEICVHPEFDELSGRGEEHVRARRDGGQPRPTLVIARERGRERRDRELLATNAIEGVQRAVTG